MNEGKWKVQAALNQGRAHQNRWVRRLARSLVDSNHRARNAVMTMDELVFLTSAMSGGEPISRDDFKDDLRRLSLYVAP